MEYTSICVKISPYTNRVLGVVKEKYGLKDKGEALDKFAAICGEDFVEKDIADDVIEDALQISQSHQRKHGMRKMSKKELDALFQG